jgi:hypothetical protein
MLIPAFFILSPKPKGKEPPTISSILPIPAFSIGVTNSIIFDMTGIATSLNKVVSVAPNFDKKGVCFNYYFNTNKKPRK